jgi:septal ring factor EnvC (AmiA/AmiB activator)
MTGLSADRNMTVDLEDLLRVVHTQNRERPAPVRKAAKKSNWRHFPVTTLLTVMLIVALGTMVTVLKAEITSLKSDLTDLKSLKAQVASLDPKLELASVETKIEKRLSESSKEQERIRTDIAQMRTYMEGLKAPAPAPVHAVKRRAR